MKRIPVYQRARFFGWTSVDDSDYDDLMNWLWRVTRAGYVYRNLSGGGVEYMHRRIMGVGPADECDVDHFDGDKLNNQRNNLRVGPRSFNAQNVPSRGGTSRFRGVCFIQGKGWRAQAQVKGKHHHLGYFPDELDAARVAAEFRRRHMPGANPARDHSHELGERERPREAA